MRALTRTWQMLLKALDEVAAAPNPMMAAEMAIIRLTHVADLPSPEELVRRLSDAGGHRGRSREPGRSLRPRAAGRGGGAAQAQAVAPPSRCRLGAGGRDHGAGALRALRGRGGADPGAAGHEPPGRGRERAAAGGLQSRAHRVRAGARMPRPSWRRGWRSGCRLWTGVRWGVSVVVPGRRAPPSPRSAPRGRATCWRGPASIRWCRRCSRPSRAPRSGTCGRRRRRTPRRQRGRSSGRRLGSVRSRRSRRS